MLISNADYEMQYLVQTGSTQVTSELIAHLEIAMRRSKSKPKLPSVRQLNYDDMHALKRSILSETAVHPVRKTIITVENQKLDLKKIADNLQIVRKIKKHIYYPILLHRNLNL